jgi:hypothetical protein
VTVACLRKRACHSKLLVRSPSLKRMRQRLSQRKGLSWLFFVKTTRVASL